MHKLLDALYLAYVFTVIFCLHVGLWLTGARHFPQEN